MEYAINKNNNFNSLEITFAGKPDEQTRAALKANGYRWHGVRRLWYGYTDEQTIRAALDGVTTTNTDEQTTNMKTPAKAAKNRLPSLWERCDISGIKQHDKNALPPVKDIAALLRKELKTRFPEVKFSITSTYNTIDAYIKASPYGREHVYKDRRTGEPDKYGYFEDSDELNAVQAYCKAFADSWNYDDSDSMTDYFDVHFYGGYFQIPGNYEQTEPTDEQPTKAEDILRYWKKYDYILTEYTSAAGKKCYRTVGLQAYYAALCRRFRLDFEFLGDFYYTAKGDGFTLEYVEGDIILAIENKEEGENK